MDGLHVVVAGCVLHGLSADVAEETIGKNEYHNKRFVTRTERPLTPSVCRRICSSSFRVWLEDESLQFRNCGTLWEPGGREPSK